MLAPPAVRFVACIIGTAAVTATLLALWACSDASGVAMPDDDVGSSPSGETIVRWNENNFAILTTLDDETPAGLRLIRELAMVHIAMHDAANGARKEFEHYALNDEDSKADPALSAAAAAHALLVVLRPGRTAQVDALLQTDLERVSDADRRQRSLDLGVAAARAIIEARADDGFFEVVPYTFGPSEPGVWQPVGGATTAVGTHLPLVTPFALESTDQFRAPPPPLLSDPQWKSDFDEVKELGRGSTARSATTTRPTPHSSGANRHSSRGTGSRVSRQPRATRVSGRPRAPSLC
jgi:hypothetical protein